MFSKPDRKNLVYAPPQTIGHKNTLMERVALLATAALVFSIPFENMLQLGVGSITKIPGFLVLGTGVLVIAEGRQLRPFHPFHIVFAIYALWIVTSIQWSISFSATYVRLLSVGQFFALTMFIWNICKSYHSYSVLVNAYVAGVFIVNVAVMYEYFSQGQAVARYTALNSNPNGIAFHSAIFSMLSWLLVWKTSRLRYIPLVLFGLLTIVLTQSRGGFLSVVPLLFLIVRSIPIASRRTVVSVVILAVLAYFVQSNILSSEQLARIQNIPDDIRSGNLANRIEIWAQVEDFSAGNWLIGTGYNTYRVQGIGRPAHNTWLSLFVSIGVIGLLLFASMLLIVFREILHLPGLEKITWMLILFSWMIASISSDLENSKITWIILPIALIPALSRFSDSSSSECRQQELRQHA